MWRLGFAIPGSAQFWEEVPHKRPRAAQWPSRLAIISSYGRSGYVKGLFLQNLSVTGPFLVVDLVPDVVLAGRLVHRNALFFFQRIRVVHNDGTVVVPDAQQQLLTMAIKLHMGGYLTRLRLEGLDDLQGLLVDDVHLVGVGAEEQLGSGVA